MTDELIKQLFNANIITVLGVALTLAIFFLARGRGKATAAEAESSRLAQQNDGKMIDAITKNADTMSAVKDTFAKMADLQADAIEWHKSHSKAIDDTNSALVILTKNVKERSDLDGQAFEELRLEMKATDEQVDARLKALEEGVRAVNTTIQGLPNCESYTAEINAMEKRLMTAIKEQAIRETSTNVTVNTQPATILADDAGAKPAGESKEAA